MKSLLLRARLHDPVRLATVALTVLLAAKFFLPLLRFDVPLGYDVGMYRYLFLAYAPFWPPFTLPDLPAWAQEHPVGLFLFTTPFLKAGFPVDWLIGWIWNLVPVVLTAVLGWVIARRSGRDVLPWVLACALCSAAYFDGFAAMYWKTFASLLFVVLTFHFTEKLSPWALLFALLAFVTHHQTGLILGLALGTWWIASVPSQWRNRRWRWGTLGLIAAAGVSLLFYLPQWDRAVLGPLLSIFAFHGDTAPAGAFPDSLFYLRTSGLLLVLGVAGVLLSLRAPAGRRSIWLFAVLWCAVFIVFRLVFYNRFYLQLDFFLLPYAACAAREAWKAFSGSPRRWLVPAVLTVQAAVSFQASLLRVPNTTSATVREVKALEAQMQPGDRVLALENQSAMTLRGWLPRQEVYAPGLFGFSWTYQQWEEFLLGTHEQRAALARTLPPGMYLYASEDFGAYYGEYADLFLEDPCIAPSRIQSLYLVSCP